MKKIFKLLIICLLFLPFIIKANQRETIYLVESTSNLKDIVVIGKEIKNPTFKVTKGEPCYFGSDGKWQKNINGNWSTVNETTFSNGTYRYYFVIRTDNTHNYDNMNGSTHIVNSIETKIVIDDQNAVKTDNGNGVKNDSSEVYAYTYDIIASEPVIDETIVEEPVQVINNQKPNKPNVTIQKGNNNSLIININKDNNAKSYDIYRSTNKKKGYKSIKNITTNTYTDTSLKYGTTYYYKVIAKNSYGKSVYSNIVSKKVVPNKISDISLDNNTTTSLKLTYKLSGAKGYVIYRSTNPNSGFKQITSTTKTTYIDKKLKTGTTYYYKIKAYVLVKKKKIYGELSNVYGLEVKPSKPIINVNNKSRSSLEFIFNNSEKISYEIGMLSGNNIVSTKSGDKVVFDNLTYGKSYKFKAFSYKIVNDRKIKSDEVLLEEMVRPPLPRLTIDDQFFYDRQDLHAQIPSLEENDDLEVLMYYKSNENDSYELIVDDKFKNNSELSFNDLKGPFYQIDLDKSFIDLNINQRYYYKMVVKINGVASKEQYISKVSQVNPTLYFETIDADTVQLSFARANNNENDVVYYELYSSTTKKGKYSLIMNKALQSSPDNYIYLNINPTFNKTYYYKLRFYIYKNGKKFYSNYSNVYTYKNTIKSYNTFPIQFNDTVTGSSNKSIIKSVGFTLKKKSGNNNTYSVKINFKSTYSKSKTYNMYTMRFYDYNGNALYDVTIYPLVPKGTKKNWSTTTTFTIPKNAVYYSFM